MSARNARGVVLPVTVFVPVPPPRMFVKPTNPSKSVILRRIAYIGERCCGVQRVMVDKNPKRLKWRKTTRNRIDLVAPGALPILIVVGMSRLWM
jgi:hypothetical protein